MAGSATTDAAKGRVAQPSGHSCAGLPGRLP